MATLRKGSTGPEVTAWQQYLEQQGYPVAVDGVFGDQTVAFTMAWQGANGLDADGIVGPASRAAASSPAPAPSTTPANGRLSARGRELVKAFEGLRLTAYPDGKSSTGEQRYSIGYGHNGASKDQTITKAEADRLFDGDVARFEAAVASACPRALQHQFDAMVSLAYNIGAEAFSRSTLARRHNAGDVTGAADQFLEWNQSGGKVLAVLESRRERERDVYLHGYGSAPPTARSGAGLAVLLVAGAGVAALALLGGWRWH